MRGRRERENLEDSVARDFLGEHFWKGKALLFPGEKPRDGKPRTFLFVGRDSFMCRGKAATLRDIDVIAVARQAAVKVGTCRYRGRRSGRKAAFVKYRTDVIVRLHDRRTGKRLAQKRYKGGRPECKATIRAGQSGAGKSYVSKDKVRNWAYARFRKIRGR